MSLKTESNHFASLAAIKLVGKLLAVEEAHTVVLKTCSVFEGRRWFIVEGARLLVNPMRGRGFTTTMHVKRHARARG